MVLLNNKRFVTAVFQIKTIARSIKQLSWFTHRYFLRTRCNRSAIRYQIHNQFRIFNIIIGKWWLINFLTWTLISNLIIENMSNSIPRFQTTYCKCRITLNVLTLSQLYRIEITSQVSTLTWNISCTLNTAKCHGLQKAVDEGDRYTLKLEELVDVVPLVVCVNRNQETADGHYNEREVE